jgi:hypothetical protein
MKILSNFLISFENRDDFVVVMEFSQSHLSIQLEDDKCFDEEESRWIVLPLIPA